MAGTWPHEARTQPQEAIAISAEFIWVFLKETSKRNSITLFKRALSTASEPMAVEVNERSPSLLGNCNCHWHISEHWPQLRSMVSVDSRAAERWQPPPIKVHHLEHNVAPRVLWAWTMTDLLMNTWKDPLPKLHAKILIMCTCTLPWFNQAASEGSVKPNELVINSFLHVL